jgi:isopentenyldiphosphate isomerase
VKGIKMRKLGAAHLLLPLRKLTHAKDEWVDIVSPESKIIGKAPRSVCHSGPGLLHRVVHLHVTDSRGRLYLQKRSRNKKIQPGRWDTSVGGHVDSGETVESALIRETREELGIEGFKPRFLTSYVWESEQESELVYSYTAEWNGEITFDPIEIDEGRFWTHREINLALEETNKGTDRLTPNFMKEYIRLKDHLLPVK